MKYNAMKNFHLYILNMYNDKVNIILNYQFHKNFVCIYINFILIIYSFRVNRKYNYFLYFHLSNLSNYNDIFNKLILNQFHNNDCYIDISYCIDIYYCLYHMIHSVSRFHLFNKFCMNNDKVINLNY